MFTFTKCKNSKTQINLYGIVQINFQFLFGLNKNVIYGLIILNFLLNLGLPLRTVFES